MCLSCQSVHQRQCQHEKRGDDKQTQKQAVGLSTAAVWIRQPEKIIYCEYNDNSPLL